VFRLCVSDTAQVEQKSERVSAPARELASKYAWLASSEYSTTSECLMALLAISQVAIYKLRKREVKKYEG
jgi:hypothetical protein